MDENRQFFRIKNNGAMRAHIQGKMVYIIDISANGVALKTEAQLPPSGIMELQINLFQLKLNYDFLKADCEKTILIFKNEEQNIKLLAALKNLR